MKKPMKTQQQKQQNKQQQQRPEQKEQQQQQQLQLHEQQQLQQSDRRKSPQKTMKVPSSLNSPSWKRPDKSRSGMFFNCVEDSARQEMVIEKIMKKHGRTYK